MGKISRFIFGHGRRVDAADRTTVPVKQAVPSEQCEATYDKDLTDQYRCRRKATLDNMFGGRKE